MRIYFWTRVDLPGLDIFEKVDYLKFSFAWVILPFPREKENVTLTIFNILLRSICYEMTSQVLQIATNYYQGCILLLNSRDDV